jgi:hypothetical protein
MDAVVLKAISAKAEIVIGTPVFAWAEHKTKHAHLTQIVMLVFSVV